MNKWLGKIYKVIHTKVKICLVRRSRGGNLRKSGYIRGAKDAFPKWVYRQAFGNMNEAVHIN